MKYINTLTSLLMLIVLSINSSYAESKCYMRMRSLDLSVNAKEKTVCQADKVQATQKRSLEKEKADKESAIQLNGYFVRPEVENKEKATSADGLGIGMKVKF